jgi:hypothetical protein
MAATGWVNRVGLVELPVMAAFTLSWDRRAFAHIVAAEAAHAAAFARGVPGVTDAAERSGVVVEGGFDVREAVDAGKDVGRGLGAVHRLRLRAGRLRKRRFGCVRRRFD